MEGEMKRTEIMNAMNLSHRGNFITNYLMPAIKQELLEYTHPEHPNHPKQKYRLTNSGKELKQSLQ